MRAAHHGAEDMGPTMRGCASKWVREDRDEGLDFVTQNLRPLRFPRRNATSPKPASQSRNINSGPPLQPLPNGTRLTSFGADLPLFRHLSPRTA